MRTVYVNGAYLPEDQASVSIFDRGFLFADSVYEVTAVLDGKLIDFDGHMRRLARSLGELSLAQPADRDELLAIHRRLVELNAVDEGLVYMQVTRGVADRDFPFPKVELKPTLVMFTQKKPLIENPIAKRGQKVALAEDLRWRRGDIKTTQLLYAAWAKTEAKAKGADDVWLVRDGKITEGSSNNAFIVTKDAKIVTRNLSNDILAGITRHAVLKCAAELKLDIVERAFTPEEAKSAAEAFSTSSSAFANPVVEIDGVAIGNGKPGPVTGRLREVYIEEYRKAAI